jgi:hypothetical protein
VIELPIRDLETELTEPLEDDEAAELEEFDGKNAIIASSLHYTPEVPDADATSPRSARP